MAQRPNPVQQLQAPRAPSRRLIALGASGEAAAPAETPSRANRILRQREMAQAARQQAAASPSGRRRPPAAAIPAGARPASVAGEGVPGASISMPGTQPGSTSLAPAGRRVRAVASPVIRAVQRPQPALHQHPLTDPTANAHLRAYDTHTKERFDQIVPVLKRLSALQHEPDFVERAQQLARRELGTELPLPILESAWTSQLDMRTLFAWCVFEAYEQTSRIFFDDDPLAGEPGDASAKAFEAFLLDCGFHLLDITPCADGRLAHAIAYALRLPVSSVRRRPHAGAMFDVENTVDRWVKTEHRRYREAIPNPAHADTHYLKVVVYHFSSRDPAHEGCAAHGSDDAAAAAGGLQRLRDFQQAVENSFCCGASVDLLLLGMDTDTDAIRAHVPGADGTIDVNHWIDARDLYSETVDLDAAQARVHIARKVEQAAASRPQPGMVRLVARLLENNFSQLDYVRQFHEGSYSDAGHAERFIGVGIGFKEIHLRNLTYFAYMDTVEEGAPDLDVGVKIFSGLNVSRGLPIPVVLRFDYHGAVPGARERAMRHCQRVRDAIASRYADLCRDGLLHTLLTVRDRDRPVPAETIGSSILLEQAGGH
ncbi:MAG: carboxysome shell carbonic anhydrase [Synechococcaceae cyanobacterium]